MDETMRPPPIPGTTPPHVAPGRRRIDYDSLLNKPEPTNTALLSVIVSVTGDLSAETAARIAADNALANAVSVVSNALSVETVARIAKDDFLSNRISSLSSLISVVGAFGQIDGGEPDSIYGGTSPVDGGGP
jgi:hypothetical protein